MKKFCLIGISSKFTRAKSGFTLIELLVVISIAGILFTIGVVQYMNFNRLQILDQSAQDLKNNLRMAQAMASNGEKPEGCSVLDGYRVFFSSNPNPENPDFYSIQAICGGVEATETKTFYLPLLVKFSSLPSPVLFKVLGHGTDLTEDLTISLTGFNKIKTIKISKTGEIREIKNE